MLIDEVIDFIIYKIISESTFMLSIFAGDSFLDDLINFLFGSFYFCIIVLGEVTNKLFDCVQAIFEFNYI